MRTRRFPSSIRTGGRMHRMARRYYYREAAEGREVPSPDRKNAYDCVKILRDMYTHIRLVDASKGERASDYMNRIITQGERDRNARAKVARIAKSQGIMGARS